MDSLIKNTAMNRKQWVRTVLDALSTAHPDAAPELDFNNPFELLIATILSAQCTDKQVNRCTAELFRIYPDPQKLAEAKPSEVESYIRSCGFYRNKAVNIVEASRIIVSIHNGLVPNNRAALEALPGVGRKTASVVLSNAFGVPAIAVDTHVFRVSNRIGLAASNTVEGTEKQLMEVIPEEEWSIAHHWLIFHGRRVCSARNPSCASCNLKHLCMYNEKDSNNKR